MNELREGSEVIFKTQGENGYSDGWIVKLGPLSDMDPTVYADVRVSMQAPMLFIRLDKLYPHPKPWRNK